MPNKAAAKKALRQTRKNTLRNLTKKRKVKDLVKTTLAAIEKKTSDSAELLRKTAQAVDKAAKTHTIHRNKASRIKSRLQKKLNRST